MEADVALVLEGTYPYHLGGVTTWVDGLVRGLPGVRFGVVHLYAGGPPGPARMDVPGNVVWQVDLRLPDDLAAVDPAALAARVPPCALVHALSTGFAGLVAAETKRQRGVPFLLTEHGIYWHEIERGAPELETGLRLLGADVSGGNPCASRAGWVARFQDHARRAYAAADHVTTVTEANRPLQARLGLADAEVIPNAVAWPAAVGPLSAAEVAALDASAARPAAFRVGFVGRVTPLKDVHTIVRAFADVAGRVPGARLHLVGPTDDAAYAASCRRLAEARGVAGRVHQTGAQPVPLWLRHLDAVVLASQSEAEPLALLEAMAHGVPVVAPAVGGVRALVVGGERAPAGLVLDPPSSGRPGALDGPLADALVRLAGSPALRRELGAAGRARTRDRSVEAVAVRYGQIYRQLRSPRAASEPRGRTPAGEDPSGLPNFISEAVP